MVRIAGDSPTGRTKRINPLGPPVEKRRDKRVNVTGDVSGRMVLVSDPDIRDLDPASPGDPMGHEAGVAFGILSQDARASLEKLILLVEQD
jgi:hypothetical protein